MKSKTRKYFSELLTIAINVASVIIVFVTPQITSVDTKWAASLIIVSTSLVLLASKFDVIDEVNHVIDEVNERLHLYQLFEKIEDRDLREVGMDHIHACRSKLEELSRGILSAPSAELVRFLSDKVASAKIGIKATLVVDTPEDLKQWLHPPATNYYEINKMVAQSGKKFQRIFVVKRERFFHGGFFDQEAADLILKQQEDGLDVYIAFEEDLRNLKALEDFVIVDRDLVHINDTGAITLRGWRTRVIKSHDDVMEYEKKFDILLAYAGRADKIIGSVSRS